MQIRIRKHRLISQWVTDMRTVHTLKQTSLAIGVIQALSAAPGLAATITVNNGTDGAVGCTLRSAIASINTAQNSGGCSAVGEFGIDDVIAFGVNNVSGLTSSLDITSSVSINPFGDSISISSLGNGSVLDIRDSTVSLDNVIVSGGSANLDGGGIFVRDSTLRLNISTVMGNSANDDGGGIFARESVVFLNNSTVAGNSAGDDGGGVYARSSTVTLSDSTVAVNGAYDEGAGIFTTSNLLMLSNSTISGNNAGDEGGGILIDFNSDASIINSTISNNTADRTGGGISITSGTTSLRNSLVAGNNTGNGLLAVSELFVRAAATFNLTGKNLLGDDSKTNQEAFNFTPTENVILSTSDSPRAASLSSILSPLADNGGPTLTHALPEGSPAIDAANGAICAASPIRNRDQRNFLRLAPCDIGALEFGAALPSFNPAIIVPPIILVLDEDD